MTKHADLATRLSYALAWVRGKTELTPVAGIILGSGLGGFADRIEDPVVIPYGEIPSFPVSRIPGHRGRLVLGELPVEGQRIPVVAMDGRVHCYEGWSAADVAFGARVLCGLGVKLLLVTNAAGGVNPSFAPGDLVRITDHLDLSGLNPLAGEENALGERFVDLTEAYDARYGKLLEEVAAERGIPLRAGVYACKLGPSYETPAEIGMLERMGADAVCMSTAAEVAMAASLGVPVAGISCVTNWAAGRSPRKLSHAEVVGAVQAVAPALKQLLERLILALA
jgi:purine-nucleoside phosphorylase